MTPLLIVLQPAKKSEFTTLLTTRPTYHKTTYQQNETTYQQNYKNSFRDKRRGFSKF